MPRLAVTIWTFDNLSMWQVFSQSITSHWPYPLAHLLLMWDSTGGFLAFWQNIHINILDNDPQWNTNCKIRKVHLQFKRPTYHLLCVVAKWVSLLELDIGVLFCWGFGWLAAVMLCKNRKHTRSALCIAGTKKQIHCSIWQRLVVYSKKAKTLCSQFKRLENSVQNASCAGHHRIFNSTKQPVKHA